jgi:LysM repeat protein
MAQASEMKPSPSDRGQNVYPEKAPSDVIRPKPDVDHSSTEAPPRSPDPSPAPLVVTPPPKVEEPPVPPPASKTEHVKTNEKPVNAAGYPKTVKVQPGESLWAIAVREYGAKVGPKMMGLIADANPKVRPEALKAGTELSLPAPSSEVADAKVKSDTDKKPSTGSGAKVTPASSKPPARKLPFVPGN